jgi:hypothetical protein
METSEIVGWIIAGLTVGAAVWMTLVLRPSRVRIFAWVIAIVHPGWWLSARSGDCGIVRLFAALLFIIPLVFVGAYSFSAYRRQRAQLVLESLGSVAGEGSSAAAPIDLSSGRGDTP